MRELFTVSVKVDTPIVIGQDNKSGRRQLIPITSGTVTGVDMDGKPMNGTVLPGGVDSQVIRPDGKCELSARYGVRLDNGSSFFIENNGIRTVPDAYVAEVLQGKFIDPSLYYFATTPFFEVYSDDLQWLTHYIFVCKAKRDPDAVHITYFVID